MWSRLLPCCVYYLPQMTHKHWTHTPLEDERNLWLVSLQPLENNISTWINRKTWREIIWRHWWWRNNTVGFIHIINSLIKNDSYCFNTTDSTMIALPPKPISVVWIPWLNWLSILKSCIGIQQCTVCVCVCVCANVCIHLRGGLLVLQVGPDAAEALGGQRRTDVVAVPQAVGATRPPSIWNTYTHTHVTSHNTIIGNRPYTTTRPLDANTWCFTANSPR